MNVYRIHIRPSGGRADGRTTFDYCLHHGVLGVGWRTKSQRSTKDWSVYEAEARELHPSLAVCSYIERHVRPNDLVWTRDLDGRYYLARVTSSWEYWSTEEAITEDIDIANVFFCDIRQVPTEAVPGMVVASFRAPRSIQAVNEAHAQAFTKRLWNDLAGENTYDVDRAAYNDPFMMLDDRETEDLLFLYLQTRGWFVLPSTRRKDTMSFEYGLVNPRQNVVAWAQVKTGNTPLDPSSYAKYPHPVFLFEPNEIYTSVPPENVTCVSRSEMLGFIDESMGWLPEIFKVKLEYVSG